MSQGEDGKLSKEEVEALLQATREGEPEPVERPEPARRVHGYDFLQPSRFNKSALEKLRKINDTLGQTATQKMGRLMRSSLKTQLVSMDHMKWESFLDETGDSAVGFSFAMAPLGHRGLLTFDRKFAHIALDRLTGGTGESPDDTGSFAPLDIRTLSRLAQVFLEPLPEAWKNLGRFSVATERFVEDLQGSDLFPPDEDLFQLCFLVQGAVGSGQVALSVPFQAVKGLPPQDQETAGPGALSAEEARTALRQNIRETDVELTILLGRADIKVANLVRVEPGDVIVLDTAVGEALDIKVNDKTRLRGFPGLHRGKYAVKLILED